MATYTETYRRDDIDGSQESETVKVETVYFLYDGKYREIDLSGDNLAKYRRAMATYVKHSRVTTRLKVSANNNHTGQDTTTARVIREWAKGQPEFKNQVKDRGRLDPDVVAAYVKAHQDNSEEPPKTNGESE